MSLDLIINAYNIPGGGGAKLLRGILECDALKKLKVKLLLDKRFSYSGNQNADFIKNTFADRLKAEWSLFKGSKTAKKVLCLGNLPPMFPLKAQTFLFIQNKYLVSKHPIDDFSLFARNRIRLERFWLKLFKGNVDQFIVQTKHMQDALEKNLGVPKEKIKVLTFDAASVDMSLKSVNEGKLSQFLYVASGEPHKNHSLLLQAWKRAVEKNPHLKLSLTISQGDHPDIQGVDYLGSISSSELEQVYKTHDALIFPSLLESLGLPLIEAMSHQMTIAASDLDFVHELLTPSVTFNPYKADDIVNALLLLTEGQFEPSHFRSDLKIVGPDEFVQLILNS